MLNRRLIALAALVAFCIPGNAQQWVTEMQDPHGNFYTARDAFESYWQTHDKHEKGKGYKAFKRWENFVERRVYPSGDLAQLQQTAVNYEAFLASNKPSGKNIGSGAMIASATWTAVGPMGPISGTGQGQLLKSGRINFITVDPSNASKLWVGAPAGGLWSSTNGGTSWTTNTDNLSVIGCSGLAIDPTNTLVMYLATGDGDAGDTRSIGVLKSTNGGSTWSATGFSYAVSTYMLIRRIIINPNNTQVLLIGTNNGVYRTVNGGTSWTQVSTANCYDLEFKPGNPNIVYAAGSSFRMSTNGGASFTQINSGIATSGVNRMAIAVTPADTNYVYVLASSSANSGLYGFYRSTSGGTSFSQMTTTLNLLGYSSTGSDTGGQGWYDLCIAASPLNKFEVVTGGVNVWRTLDGGASWGIYSHWTANGAPFSHADQHCLYYDAAGTLYGTNDGTVYRRTATAWQEISGTMNISQIYKIGLSTLTANKWITGHQDNGTAIYNGTTYTGAMGGDGMDCFISRTSDNTMFAEYYNGDLQRSSNGGGSWSAIQTGLSGSAPWVTAWKQDPVNPNTLYCGYTELFKSTNLGTTWTQLTAMGGSGSVIEFAIAPSNSLVIYALKSSGIYKTVNGGSSWTNVTGSVPVASGQPQFVVIDPTDATNAWVVLSGYSSGNKVFMTTNGGSSWTNWSSNLPNIPGNCLVYQPGTNDRIYVGMDVGIYYRDNLSASWTLYNASLPNVPISDMEISPATPALLHAATYGRGVWVASLVPSTAPPVSSFLAPAAKCQNSAMTFSDQSSNAPTSWSWSVLPSTGVTMSSGTVQNPTVTFASPGTYTVSLLASNSNGPGATTSQVIVVSSAPPMTVSSYSQNVCAGSVANFTASGASSYTWSNGGGNMSYASFYTLFQAVYTVTGSTSGCQSVASLTVSPQPVPNVSISGPSSACAGSVVSLQATGAQTYTWNTLSNGAAITVTASSSMVYSVSGANGAGCAAQAVWPLNVNPLPAVSVSANDSIICASEEIVLNANGATSYTWMPGGANGPSLSDTPASSVTYTVTGMDDNGCSADGFLSIAVNVCEKLEKPAGLSSLSLFPNPAHDRVEISAGPESNAASLRVFDAQGREVMTRSFTLGRKAFQLDLSPLPKAVYMVEVKTQKETSLIKLVKE